MEYKWSTNGLYEKQGTRWRSQQDHDDLLRIPFVLESLPRNLLG